MVYYLPMINHYHLIPSSEVRLKDADVEAPKEIDKVNAVNPVVGLDQCCPCQLLL